MPVHQVPNLGVEEPDNIWIETSIPLTENHHRSFFRRLFTLDDGSRRRQHRPLFIIGMSILHVVIFSLRYIDVQWRGISLAENVYNFFSLYVPCMRPAPDMVRFNTIRCIGSTSNDTCTYDDALRYMCYSVAYPHQLWRLVTINFPHGGWLHLLSNLLAQVLQGIPLERKYGSLRLALIYWLSGVGASLSYTTKYRSHGAVGASGSLYGLMLFLVVDRLSAMSVEAERRCFIFAQLLLLLLPHFAVSVPLILRENVMHLAHLSAGLVGFLCSVSMLGCPWLSNNRNDIRQIILRCIAFGLLCLYFACTSAFFFLSYAPAIY